MKHSCIYSSLHISVLKYSKKNHCPDVQFDLHGHLNIPIPRYWTDWSCDFFFEKKSTFDSAKESIFFAEIIDSELTEYIWQDKVCSLKALSICFGKQ